MWQLLLLQLPGKPQISHRARCRLCCAVHLPLLQGSIEERTMELATTAADRLQRERAVSCQPVNHFASQLMLDMPMNCM